jgi:quinoprotein glucose dehydrogenase
MPKQFLRVTALAASVAFLLVSSIGAQRAQREGEWRNYAGDVAQTKYSPLSQVDKNNVKDLRVAWRWTTADRPLQLADPLLRAGRNEETPLMVNGALYTVTGLGLVAALDPATGTTRWVYDPESYKAGRPNNVGFVQRGLAYWSNGSQERLFVGTADAYLLSIDARTGKPDLAFGDRGKADLTVGIRDAVRATNFTARRPLVAGGVVVVGNSIADYVMDKEAPPGYVHAFDVRTGRLRWTFHTIPKPGEPGYESWLDNSAEYSGSVNVWSSGVYDPELDYVYLPVSTPTNNYYGGHRHGNNLFAESLLCLEAKTGKLVWHFQAVHHGIWDYDFPTHPILGDVTVDGRRTKAVIQVSKQAFTFAFDRKSGVPVWPIEERPVLKGSVPGEWYAPTQPFPTKPPAFDLQGATEGNLIDLTPDLKKRAVAQLQLFEHGPLFTPPVAGKPTLLVPGILGGANWGGAAFDPDTGYLYVPSRLDPSAVTLVPPTKGNMRYVRADTTLSPKELSMDGLPIFKPPYSRVTAIDMNKGEHRWIAAIGNGPRHHPLLTGLTVPPLGESFQAGVSALVTKTLLFVSGSPRPTEWSDPDAARKLVFVFDKQSGALVREIELEGFSAAAPMTYLHGGKQYIVVATGSGPTSDLTALSLP